MPALHIRTCTGMTVAKNLFAKARTCVNVIKILWGNAACAYRSKRRDIQLFKNGVVVSRVGAIMGSG
jgi:hypothetical protein